MREEVVRLVVGSDGERASHADRLVRVARERVRSFRKAHVNDQVVRLTTVEQVRSDGSVSELGVFGVCAERHIVRRRALLNEPHGVAALGTDRAM